MPGRGIILVVEDDASICKLIVRVIGNMKAAGKITPRRIVRCVTGCEGMQAIEKSKVALAILDYRLPGSHSGMDVAIRLKDLQASAQVIMIAGMAPEIGSELMKEFGVDAFFGKPFDWRKFENQVRTRLKEFDSLKEVQGRSSAAGAER